MVPTLTSDMFEKLAPEFGLSVWVEPRWRSFGYLQLHDGTRRYWNGSALDLNTVGAAELTRDKAYTNLVLRKAGFPVPQGHAFGSSEWCASTGSTEGFEEALTYADSLGYPLIVKPNSSQGGRLVFRAMNRDDLAASLNSIFREHTLALIEEKISGRDARLLVLDGEVVLAYERLPLTVVGNGKHSIHELMLMRAEALVRIGRPTRVLEEEGRVAFTVRQEGDYGLNTVLPKGEELVLLPSANLATGGSTVRIGEGLHQTFKKMAVEAVQCLNLRFAGVDIMTNRSANWEAAADSGTSILEVNGKQPAVTHFAHGHAKEAEDFYRKLLQALVR